MSAKGQRVALDGKRRKRLYRGFIAPCARCGREVVHAISTLQPFHMHRYSALCSRLAAERKKTPAERRSDGNGDPPAGPPECG